MKISRRNFGAIAAAMSVTASAAARPSSRPMLIKPPRLRRGDVVGLIAPGGYTNDAAIEKAVRNIEALGFRVKPGAYLREVFGNYAGSTQQRLADLHAMFADPEVKESGRSAVARAASRCSRAWMSR